MFLSYDGFVGNVIDDISTGGELGVIS